MLMSPNSPHSFADLIRRSDYDRYLSALFAPAGPRAHLFALYAFNFEIAKTAETVSQGPLGLIRLQWWREAIDELYSGNVRQHEVLLALARAVSAYDLPRALFDAMIDAREADLEETPFATLEDLEAYADATSGHVMRLSARILGAGDKLDAVARDAGIAYALTGLLRALPYRAARRNLPLPLDALLAEGMSHEDVFAGEVGSKLGPIIGPIAERASAHLQAARVARIPRAALPAFLPASLTPAYVRQMMRPGFNPFRDATEIAPHRRQLVMLRAMVRGRL